MFLKPFVGWTSFELYSQRQSAATEQTNLLANMQLDKKMTVQASMWLDKHWPPTTHQCCKWLTIYSWWAEAEPSSVLQWFKKTFNSQNQSCYEERAFFMTLEASCDKNLDPTTASHLSKSSEGDKVCELCLLVNPRYVSIWPADSIKNYIIVLKPNFVHFEGHPLKNGISIIMYLASCQMTHVPLLML